MVVRRLLHSLGYRYRLHRKDLPGKPDIVFSSRRKVVFVHGCFWHSHNVPGCRNKRKPKSNAEYWLRKLERNQARDQANIAALDALGWSALVVWECKTKERPALAERLQAFLC